MFKKLIVISILLFCFCLISTDLESMEKKEVKVLRVSDGDTILVSGEKLKKDRYIRLSWIDCPEVQHGKKFVGGQSFGKEATEFLRKLILDKKVMLHIYGEDHYNRLLAEVWFNGENINELMVKKGLAYAFAIKGDRPPIYNIKAEIYARKNKLGLWNSSIHIRPRFYRKYWLIRNLLLDYKEKTKCIRWVKKKKLLYSIIENDKKIDESIIEFKMKLRSCGIKYIPIPYFFTMDEKSVVGFEVKKFKRNKKSEFPYFIIESGKYGAVMNMNSIDNKRVDDYINSLNKKGVGKYFQIIWVTKDNLKRENYPQNEVLYEVIRRIEL